MRFTMFSLGKSEKLGLDNKDFDIYNFQDKLREEYKEVMYEADIVRIYRKSNCNKLKEHRRMLASEIFDLIQVCIAGLVMLVKDGVDIHLAAVKHNFKLINKRAWTIDKIINIDISDGELGE